MNDLFQLLLHKFTALIGVICIPIHIALIYLMIVNSGLSTKYGTIDYWTTTERYSEYILLFAGSINVIFGFLPYLSNLIIANFLSLN